MSYNCFVGDDGSWRLRGTAGAWLCGYSLVLCAFVGMAFPKLAYAKDKNPRFSLGLSTELAWVKMNGFKANFQEFEGVLESGNPDLRSKASKPSSSTIGISIFGRAHFPYHTFLDIGIGRLTHSGSLPFEISDFQSRYRFSNSAWELPILFGYRFQARYNTEVLASFGPAFLLRSVSDWSYEDGTVSDYAAWGGGGFAAELGVSFSPWSWLGLELSCKYRYLRSSELSLSGKRSLPEPEIKELDYSGFSIVLKAVGRLR